MTNEDLLKEFYTAFKNRDSAAMAQFYTENAEFSDPVFVGLKGKEVAAMWKMLIARGKETKISFGEIKADADRGYAKWEAIYPYGKKRRIVHNFIESRFEFEDGKILKQTDSFDLRKWLGMALGPAGRLLGCSSILKNRVRAFARRALDDFMKAS
jgi:hypothetical protein